MVVAFLEVHGEHGGLVRPGGIALQEAKAAAGVIGGLRGDADEARGRFTAKAEPPHRQQKVAQRTVFQTADALGHRRGVFLRPGAGGVGVIGGGKELRRDPLRPDLLVAAGDHFV